MKKHIGLGLLALGASFPCWLSATPSYGLPGHSVNEVKTWMQGHPTLRADSREGLRVHRADIPSRRFTFQASVFPVGGFQRSEEDDLWTSSSRRRDLTTVRREEFILVNYDEQVTLANLEESLRTLYGPDIYADYRRAQMVYGYGADAASTPIQGEVRLGQVYAYWVELTSDANGLTTVGKLNVLLPEDVDRLQNHLQRQESVR